MSNAVKETKLAILFADICGSTALYEELGDHDALTVVSKCLMIMGEESTQYKGQIVKTIGDSIMCTFADPLNALEAACAMQKVLQRKRPGGDRPIHIRIGIHLGDVIFEGGELFGDTVNVAARVTSITRARQILTTRALVDVLPARLKANLHHVEDAMFRGKKESLAVYQMSWEKDDPEVTRIGVTKPFEDSEDRYELSLRFSGNTLILDEDHPSIMVGRGKDCNLFIPSTLASRQHFKIEPRFGKFIIADISSNGTYIKFSENHIIHLSRHETMLHGSGSISLGQALGKSPNHEIEYSVQKKIYP